MATGKAPDPRRRKTPYLHSSNLKVGNGQKEAGYLAGEVYGCYGHRTHAHQPCVFEITDGALQCPYCGSGMTAEWRGYVGIWDRDYTLRHCLINEDYFASVDTIEWRSQVIVSRAKNPISPLVVRDEPGILTRALPVGRPWDEPVDMLRIALGLWKSEPLNDWFKQNPPKKPARNTAKKNPESAPAEPAGPLSRYFSSEEKAVRDRTEQESKIAKIMDRVLKPAPNADGPFKPAPRKQ